MKSMYPFRGHSEKKWQENQTAIESIKHMHTRDIFNLVEENIQFRDKSWDKDSKFLIEDWIFLTVIKKGGLIVLFL